MSESSTRSGEWLTVSQAAAMLGRSERTTRRMCESGALAATMEANESGGRAWFIEKASVDRADVRPNNAATKGMTARPHSKREKSERTQNDAAIVDRADSVRPEDAAMLLREKDARIDDLRAQVESQKLQIEAANRQAAEATAALREYLKMQAKALPAPADETTSSSTRSDPVVSRRDAPQQPQNSSMSQETPDTKKAAQSGLRGEGLRELRTIFRKLFGLS